MIKLVITLCALVVLTMTYHSHRTYLSPIIPPTAFKGQYYTCQFRVLGMDFPRYEFHGLPPNMTGNRYGRVVGTPEKIGSYPVTVYYGSRYFQGETKLVFMVVQKKWPEFQLKQSIERPHQTPLLVYLQQNKTMHTYGQDIVMKVGAVGGKPPYIWTYLRMPYELQGDQNGYIRGFFDTEGSYSFGVNCADSLGHSADIFVTVNVQPMTFLGKYLINPIYVTNMDPPEQYDWDILTKVHEQITKDFHYLYSQAQKERDRYKEILLQKPQFQQAIEYAKKRVEQTVKTVNLTLAIKGKAALALTKTKAKLRASQDNFTLAKTKFQNAKIDFNDSITHYKKKQEARNKSNEILMNKTKIVIEAERESAKAEQKYNKYFLQVEGGELDVNLTFDRVLSTKGTAQRLSAQVDIHASNVNIKRNQLDIAKMNNDQAEKIHNKARDHAMKATNQLHFLNLEAAKLRIRKKVKEESLATAKFAHHQALNNLKVAQAAKTQADKLFQMAKMFGEEQSTIKFEGCSLPTYPSISGSAQVQKILTNGVKLNSGQTVIWGGCTKKMQCQVGDLVFFNGFLKNGGIHAQTIEKVYFND